MVDSIDSKVLKQLMEKARTTWAELGALLGLSAPAAAERVHKLEERGIIKGYYALIDPEAVGYGLAAYIAIYLDKPEHRKGFLEFVQDTKEIQECHHIAGDEDYVLKVRCKGTRDLERIVSENIKSIPGVAKTRTTVILSTVKENPILPI
ncbi:Lrp/AsnC family transcriptional regulator, leucine-responsive regulatory protein [Pelosinus fermentans]|jgi:Lrp/AsnC family leucine-responsive transcriptional regulator|uniref:Transcription regulator, AsnC-type n=1 Tax=Pelosinus fermentans B4 TaxID=1149862 RepID=I9B4R6_9FIRM|nr:MULTISPECIES: Lrp/AsnC family transcriptional regulator [Pelosinus]EIW20137.1 Transcription regulator, AsnC-type [Pelosinus fermentans B4]OAM93057.1 transcriptional regulator, AsnC family [Pelosinus fermentans DSM 17108]SDQ65549.1 Lrp/AsnC family transcriptional regulator, leucine-responsive regulatory protein [Pelosinus fermentans]